MKKCFVLPKYTELHNWDLFSSSISELVYKMLFIVEEKKARLIRVFLIEKNILLKFP